MHTFNSFSFIRTVFLVVIFMAGIALNAQIPPDKLVYQSNPDLSFQDYISGIRYAEIMLSATDQVQVDDDTGIAPIFYAAKKYLQDLGFEYVALTSEEKSDMITSLKSYCDYVSVAFSGDVRKNTLSNMSISFVTCLGDVFIFQSDKKFNYNKFKDVEKKLIADWKSLYGTKPEYDKSRRLVLPANYTKWTAETIKEYLSRIKPGPIEGIYERIRLTLEDVSSGKYKMAIIKEPGADDFLIVYLSGASNSEDWKAGEYKGRIFKTATPGFFSVEWVSRHKSLNDDVYCMIDEANVVSIISTGLDPFVYKFVKTFPLEGSKPVY